MAAYVIAGVIIAYSIWVIRKKYRDLKNGSFCCGCGKGCRGCSRK